MMTRKRKNSSRSSVSQQEALNYRALGVQVRAQTLNVEERSIEATLSTESPVVTWDWDRYEMVPEILRMDGAEFPSSRQVPFLDSHNRVRVADQLGSVRGVRVEGPEMIGKLVFGQGSDREFAGVRDGHVTDVSVGYRVKEKTYVPEGRSEMVAGRMYQGPVNVVTKWRLREASLTPIGADEQAKLRGLDDRRPPHFSQGSFVMDEQLRAACIELGMDKDLPDAEAQKWMAAKMRAIKEAPPPAKKEEPAAAARAEGAAAAGGIATLDENKILSLFERAIESREQKRETFRNEVKALCDLADMPEDVVREASDLTDLTKVRELISEKKKTRSKNINPEPYFSSGPSGKEKHLGALRTAIVLKSMDNSGYEPRANMRGETVDLREKLLPVAERAKGYEQFRTYSLMALAEECLRADGFNDRELRELPRDRLAMAALGFPQQAGLRAGDPAYHDTASFPLITQDARNKSMMLGYTEFPSTWQGPMRQAASVQDFKQINRYRLGAVSNLPVWVDNGSPEQAAFADARERYAVEAYSVEVSFSWRLLVNDDMDALSRTPFQLGNAASRTVNAAAWAQVTSNPKLSDAVALFSAASGARKRSNLTTGSATPTTTTMQTLTNLMMQMRGENTPEGNEGSDILNLQPAYLVGPSALRTTILQLTRSQFDPASNEFMVYNTAGGLMPVIEPLLDTASTTAFYLFASPAQIDTVEVTFLAGQETPWIRDWIDPRSLSRQWTVVQTFAAKAMNHRGMQRHDGV